METASERRKRKLGTLCAQHGLAEVARKAGLNPQTLDQIIKGVPLPPKADGSRSPRNLGTRAAHKIEDGLGLGRGWFDAPDAAAPITFSELNGLEGQLIMFFRQLTDVQRDRVLQDMNRLANENAAPVPSPQNPFPGVDRRAHERRAILTRTFSGEQADKSADRAQGSG